MLSDEDYIPWNPEESRAGEALYISNVFIPFGIQHPSQAVARVSFDSTSSPSRDYAAAASTLRNLGPSFDNAAAASLRNLGPSFDNAATASLRNLREPQESQQLLGEFEFVSYLRLSLVCNNNDACFSSSSHHNTLFILISLTEQRQQHPQQQQL